MGVLPPDPIPRQGALPCIHTYTHTDGVNKLDLASKFDAYRSPCLIIKKLLLTLGPISVAYKSLCLIIGSSPHYRWPPMWHLFWHDSIDSIKTLRCKAPAKSSLHGTAHACRTSLTHLFSFYRLYAKLLYENVWRQNFETFRTFAMHLQITMMIVYLMISCVHLESIAYYCM